MPNTKISWYSLTAIVLVVALVITTMIDAIANW